MRRVLRAVRPPSGARRLPAIQGLLAVPEHLARQERRAVPASRVIQGPCRAPEPPDFRAVLGVRDRRGHRSGDPAVLSARVATRTQIRRRGQVHRQIPGPGLRLVRLRAVRLRAVRLRAVRLRAVRLGRECAALARLSRPRPVPERPYVPREASQRALTATAPSCRRAGPGRWTPSAARPGPGYAGPSFRLTSPMARDGKGDPRRPGPGGRSAAGTEVPARTPRSVSRPSAWRRPGCHWAYCREDRR
jgi:hypothetical protein